ncbi:MAG: MFS transporter [Armatimonadetes bacterium]|nr:MFS transporter [Armatimonadota bacterium]
MRLWLRSSSLFSIFGSISGGTYATGYAIQLGANDRLPGLLAAAPAWGQALQLLSPLLIERLTRRKTLCLATYVASCSLWLPVAMIPFLAPAGWRAWLFVGLVLCAGLLTALANPATNSWYTDLIPSAYRGRFVAREQTLVNAFGLAATLCAGWWMDRFPAGHKQPGFTALFIIGVAFAMGSIATWAFVPEPRKRRDSPPTLTDLVRRPLENPDVRNYTIFCAVRTVALYTAAPFFSAYMLNTLKLSYGRIALYSMAVTLAMLASNSTWAYLAGKYGYRPLLRISTFGSAMIPFIWFFTSPHNYHVVIPLAQIWGGAIASALFLSQFNLMLKTAPAEQRSVYLGFHSSVVSVAASLGSLLGGVMAQWLAAHGPYELLGYPISHYQVLFMVSALLRFLSLPFLRLVREQPQTAALEVIRLVGQGSPLKTLWNLRRMSRASDPVEKARATRALGRTGSRLPVEELIQALDDSDHAVRLEAALALGEIGDPKAVEALRAKARDQVSDVAEVAVEALGKITGEPSRLALLELLADPRPSVRRSAAQGIGRLGTRADADALRRLVEREHDPQVLLACHTALGQVGGPEAWRGLRTLLREAVPGATRMQVANALGNVLGTPGEFYSLLQAEPLDQAGRVAAVVANARRLAAGLPGISRDDLAQLRQQIQQAGADLEAEEYARAADELRLVATRALLQASEPRGSLRRPALLGDPPNFPRARRLQGLLAEHPHLRLNFACLRGLAREAEHHPLGHEEALLAVYAFGQVMTAVGRLRHNAPRR